MRPSQKIRIPVDGQLLDGELTSSGGATGLVVCAYGSGTGRLHLRDAHVTDRLQAVGLDILTIDLLGEAERWHDLGTAAYRFDVPLLTRRLLQVLGWLAARRETRALPVGLIGAGTCDAAALVAASRSPYVRAVVSLGGRPDLAGEALLRVSAPTLFIAGEHDEDLIELSQRASAELSCERRLVILPGDTHLSENQAN
ncbi:dienelactone hydrolase family protein [Paraburkholderia sp. BR10872]|uniref:dienelactone hydrolase family protein n=1 Tax=Paraburkholderia sp. BR10872 TaxID=3236989 RepID=UPI0034D1989C